MSSRVCPQCRQMVESEDTFCPRDGTRLLTHSVYEQIAAAQDPLVGTRISGRYLLIRKLGEGGMGDVFLAEHEAIEKRLAIKLLKREYADRPDVVQRFRQEAVSASRIKHPNVVDVFDFGQIEDGRFYLAMELLEGRDLADVLASERQIDPQRAIRIGLQICRALAVAHAKGVIHRDMKPENVFLVNTPDGEEIVKIVDFGIAQLRNLTGEPGKAGRRHITKAGMIFGTPEYMAPEQAAGRPADHTIDVYATGIILFEMLTGRVPFYGPTFMAVLTAHMTAPVPSFETVSPRVHTSAELERVVSRALSKEPADRFPSMADLGDALLATPEAAVEIPIPLTREPAAAQREEATRRRELELDARQRATTEPAPESAIPASTQLGFDSQQGAGARTTSRWSAVVVGLVLLVVGFVGTAAIWKVLRPGETIVASQPLVQPGPSESSQPALSLSMSAPAGSAPAGSASAAVVVGGPLDPIIIHVESRPEGAVIKKRDGDMLFQVCEAAPCDYRAERDEKVELVAEKGPMKGTGRVLAKSSQTLVITLKAEAHEGKSTLPRTDNCEFCVPKGDPDCVKVIRPCTQPP